MSATTRCDDGPARARPKRREIVCFFSISISISISISKFKVGCHHPRRLVIVIIPYCLVHDVAPEPVETRGDVVVESDDGDGARGDVRGVGWGSQAQKKPRFKLKRGKEHCHILFTIKD